MWSPLNSWLNFNQPLSLAFYTIARYSAVLGDKEIAFHWLEQARKDHHPWLVGVNVDPQFERLRDDPRFAELVKPEVP